MSAPVGLLPCPFCGTAPQIKLIGNDHTKSRKVQIRCPECRIERTDAAIRHGHDWLVNVASLEWNNRAAPVPPVAQAAIAYMTTDKRHLLFAPSADWPIAGMTPLYAAPAPADLTDAQKAAPELLAALQVLVDNGGIGPESMFHDARDAIAKATGSQS